MLVKRLIYDGSYPIQNKEEILCEIINDEGESEIKFISITYLESIGITFDSPSTSSSSCTESILETYDINGQENINCNINVNYGHRWNEKETKYLLDQYCMYFPQIGPFRAFKNKTAMFEQISKDLKLQFNIKVTGQQCLNRFKNVNKQNKNALVGKKVSGNTPVEVPYDSEFEEIKNIDDSLQPEILLGVNHMKIHKKTKVDFSKKNIDRVNENCEYEKPKKRLKSNSLEEVLREISTTAEENRERRHKEKCDLLTSLLGKSAKDSNSE